MQLVDKCIITFCAGNGGNGIISWRKEAFYPQGGPYGGDGGNGGDIILKSTTNENDLSTLRYIKSIKAENGENGKTKLCHGKNGNDKIIFVPVGTCVIDFNTGNILYDFLKTNDSYLLCKGGKGGHGNAYFKSSFNKAPKLCENGDLGQQKKVILELKYIADVGIIGLPNAGKSSFINQISNANSKIGNYQFTTLFPVLGVVNFFDQKLIFADIPGIVENASTGYGLGLNFLKHIERCSVLIHLISCQEDIVCAYNIINNELKRCQNIIDQKKIYLVVSKKDLDCFDQAYQKLCQYFNDQQKIYAISIFDSNYNDLLEAVFMDVKKINQQKKISNYDVKVVSLDKKPSDVIKIYVNEYDQYVVESELIDYWYHKIPQTTSENILRFHQKINLDEIEKIVKKQGAKKDDTFLICGIEYKIDI